MFKKLITKYLKNSESYNFCKRFESQRSSLIVPHLIFKFIFTIFLFDVFFNFIIYFITKLCLEPSL